MNETTRSYWVNGALIAGLFAAGGLCGVGARLWMGGLKAQHAQLERCLLASKHSSLDKDAQSTLARLEVEVPACMNGAGYEKALDNESCEPAMWQGDVFCYLPKSSLGRLIYRMDAHWDGKRMGVNGKTRMGVDGKLWLGADGKTQLRVDGKTPLSLREG
jgi:hypothetical protein